MKNGQVVRLNKKINFFVLITMPKFGCSTKHIFSKVKKLSKPSYFNANNDLFRQKNLVQSNNHLENIVLKKYKKVNDLKYFILGLPKVVFVRMTGTGSALVAYFKSKKSAKTASKIFEKKYKKYWYVVSKTI